MPPQTCRVVFFGAPRIAKGNGVTITEGQIMGSTIMARKMTNDTQGGVFMSDDGASFGGVGWAWPPLEDPVWGRAKDIEVDPRATIFTLEVGIPGAADIHSNCPEGCLRVNNIYWNPVTNEIVIQTEDKEGG